MKLKVTAYVEIPSTTQDPVLSVSALAQEALAGLAEQGVRLTFLGVEDADAG